MDQRGAAGYLALSRGFCKEEDMFKRRLFAFLGGASPILAVLLACMLGMVVPAEAQNEGAIFGTVADEGEGILPGVTVTLSRPATGMVRTAVTSESGQYNFGALGPGTYDLTAELTGFASQRVEGLALTIGMQARQNMTLGLGGVQEQVTVTAEAPVIEKTRSEVAGVITQQQIDMLPIQNRQTLQLALLMPGTSNDATRPRKVNATIGAGTGFFSSTFMVDGVSNQEVKAGEPRQDFPQDGIREFKVNVSQSKAEFGGGTGGLIAIATRGGTNQLSGGAFWQFRDKSLNALNKFEQEIVDGGGDKPDFRRNQFGFSLGGAIAQDKAHFFVAVDRVETSESIIVNTGEPQFYSSVEGVFPNDQYRRLFFIRADAQMGTNQSLFVRWGHEADHRDRENSGGTRAASNGRTVEQRRHSLVVGHTWLVSNTSLNEIRFQWAPFSFLLGLPGVSSVPNERGNFDPSAERFQGATQQFNFPSLRWGSATSFVQNETWWEFRDTFSLDRGDHAIKFGGAYLKIPTPEDAIANPGTWTFGSDQFFDPDDAAVVANLQNPIRFTARFPSIVRELPNQWIQFFVQDDWRIRENVTLNLGLRYDNQYRAFNQDINATDARFDPPLTENGLASGVPLIDPPSRGDNNNFQPRMGVAWDVGNDGRSVVRGAYGRYYRYHWNGLFAGERSNLRQDNIRINNPAYPDPFQGRDPVEFASTAPPNIVLIDDNLVNPLADAFNVGLSRELTPDLALHVDGLYTRNEKEPKRVLTNLADPVTGVRPLPAWADIEIDESVGTAKYKALLARLEKRYSNNYNFLISYTLAKVDNDHNVAGVSTRAVTTDSTNPDQDFGPSNSDRRHTIVMSGAVTLGWDITLAGVWTYRTAMPFNALANADVNGDGLTDDYVPGTTRNQGNRGLDLGAVNDWRALNGLGPIAASQIENNRFNGLDFRIGKAIRFGDTHRVDIAFQVFNALGSDNLLPPGAGNYVDNSLSNSFGRILTANPRQQAEFLIKYSF